MDSGYTDSAGSTTANLFEVLRTKVRVDEVVSYVTAVEGSKARCVAHAPDAHPSMHIYDDHVHCFSCGFHGDAVAVWAKARGIGGQMEAARDLAREYGVKVPEVSTEIAHRAAERRAKEERYAEEARSCHRSLDNHSHVRKWWALRGFREDLQGRFLLGSDRNGTEAIIPFWHRGRIEGLIRRRLAGEPKYVLPVKEEFTDGHKPLFVPGPVGVDTFVVEGYVDALALAALGQSVVAIGGTNASREQVAELLWIPGSLYLLPDADDAGDEFARKLARSLFPKALVCPPEYSNSSDSHDSGDSYG